MYALGTNRWTCPACNRVHNRVHRHERRLAMASLEPETKQRIRQEAEEAQHARFLGELTKQDQAQLRREYERKQAERVDT